MERQANDYTIESDASELQYQMKAQAHELVDSEFRRIMSNLKTKDLTLYKNEIIRIIVKLKYPHISSEATNYYHQVLEDSVLKRTPTEWEQAFFFDALKEEFKVKLTDITQSIAKMQGTGQSEIYDITKLDEEMQKKLTDLAGKIGDNHFQNFLNGKKSMNNLNNYRFTIEIIIEELKKALNLDDNEYPYPDVRKYLKVLTKKLKNPPSKDEKIYFIKALSKEFESILTVINNKIKKETKPPSYLKQVFNEIIQKLIQHK